MEKRMESHAVAKKPHAVCVPMPFQSHIFAMLKLAKVLHFRGFHITFVNTEFNHQRILKSRGPDSLKGFPDFEFETIPDGLPPSDVNSSQDILALLNSIANNMAEPFHNLINKLNKASTYSDVSPVTCIISDVAARYAVEAAKELGIPGFQFLPMSAAFLLCNFYSRHLLQTGIIPFKDKLDYDMEMPVDLIPGMSKFRVKDLPPCYRGETDLISKFFIDQLPGMSSASAVIINTFNALESQVLEAMRPLLPPVYAVGPLQLLLQENSSNQLDGVGTNFWNEDEETIKWLDSKQPNSVLYVNFGSLTILTSQQFTEFAWGLANSKLQFLWVIRPGLVTGDFETFASDFIKETADRGMISSWCQQEKVLSHSSTAGFLTHSGWNSSMDTICSGVPVISWPYFPEQNLNSRYACAHWGIGLEVERNVRRDEVERLVKVLMEGEKGKEMKEKALAWKNSAEVSTKPGGTSYENVNKIIHMLQPKSVD